MNEETNNETIYPNLTKAIKKQYKDNLKYQQDKIIDVETLNYFVRWILNKRESYKGTYQEQRHKALTRYENKYNKELQQELNQLKAINESKPPHEVIITIEWKRSQMWGSNPNATDNYNKTSGSIGGCGYDKKSTATARILNQHLGYIKLMCDIKEQYLSTNIELEPNKPINNNAIHRLLLGYGSGYGIIPRFEGGVGVSCHESIMSKLGYTMRQITNTNNTDVFMITRKSD